MKPFGGRPFGNPPTRFSHLRTACRSVARRGHTRVFRPASRALRGARASRAFSRSWREAPIEARRGSGTTCVHRAFYCDHLRLAFPATVHGASATGDLQLFGPAGPSRSSWYIGGSIVTKRSHQRPAAAVSFRIGPCGQTPRSSPAGRARSNNEGQPSAAPSNPACSGLATLAADAAVRRT